MKNIIILITFFLLLFNFQKVHASATYYIDFSKVLNESEAGSKAQKFLKDKFNSESDRFDKLEKNLLKEEKDLISKKKLITEEEYKKKTQELREKVKKIQIQKRESIQSLSKSQKNARQQLLKELNPIMKEYMSQNKIRIVIDKKSVLLADGNLEITEQIIKLLNKKLKSLNLK